MSCDQATAPVNITGSIADKCTLKCSYIFGYPLTDLTVENKGDYLRFGPDPQQNPPVNYNNEKYMVQEIRLYQPSLHTWGGQHTTAELIVVHTNITTGTGLLTCVPVSAGAAITPGSDVLSSLLSRASDSAPNKGGNAGVVKLPTFTCGKFVPYSQPFYSYVGTLPYEPCSGVYNYVVFWDDSAIGVDSATASKISHVISKNSYSTKENPGGLFYNPTGAVNSEVSGDGIYIECQPTGEDGEVLVPNKLDDDWLEDLKKKHPHTLKVGKSIFTFIVVALVTYAIWRVIGSIGIGAAAAVSPNLKASSVDSTAMFEFSKKGRKQREAEKANLAKIHEKNSSTTSSSSGQAVGAGPPTYSIYPQQMGMGMPLNQQLAVSMQMPMQMPMQLAPAPGSTVGGYPMMPVSGTAPQTVTRTR